jgi:hypothetical protein
VSALRFRSWTPAAAVSAMLCVMVGAGTGLRPAHASPPAALTRVCVVPGAGKPLDQIWRPNMSAALAYARGRTGDIALAVRTRNRFYGYRSDHVEWSASVVKAMLMVAYLDRPSVRGRPLNGSDTSLLVPMITHSDNNAASIVDGIVGNTGLQGLANRVGMTHFTPVMQPWGETRITARDQTKFFLNIDKFIARRHRSFATRLLASITPSQRWGIGQVAPHGWALFFKGGWGSGTGLLDHQVVLLTRGCARVSLAVLSMYDGSHAYGKATLAGIFSRLLEGLPTGVPLYPVVDGAQYSGFVAGDTSTGRSEPNSPPVDGLSFQAARNGRSVRRFAIVLANDPKDLCPTGKAAGVHIARMTPDPDGRFSARGSGANYRYALTGRFLVRRRASGTVTETDLDPVTGKVVCEFRANWLARVVNH